MHTAAQVIHQRRETLQPSHTLQNNHNVDTKSLWCRDLGCLDSFWRRRSTHITSKFLDFTLQVLLAKDWQQLELLQGWSEFPCRDRQDLDLDIYI